MKIKSTIIHNANGIDYKILAGSHYGSPALLVRLNDEPFGFVVCVCLEEDSWYGGKYYETLDEAMEHWNKYYKEKNK